MHNLLSTSPFLGILFLPLLFLACFGCVHVVRLAKWGWETQEKQNVATKNAEEKSNITEKKQPEKTVQEPVYYIVERKRRTKSSFSEPKQIHFK